MKVLHFDCHAGISGDMCLGAFVDLGVNKDALLRELAKLKIALPWELEFCADERCGIYGTRASVKWEESGNPHTHWSEIKKMILNSDLSVTAKERAIKIFTCLAGAEAVIHNCGADDVVFHEVGAVDSIIDITGAAICLDMLNPDKITSSEVELGGGTVKCAHGTLPVPAPATLAVLRGFPVKTGGFDKEMTTPTGAAILASSVDEFLPEGTASGVFSEMKEGYGIGRRKLSRANVLRVSLREFACTGNMGEWKTEWEGGEGEKIFVIEADIDDMTGEELSFLQERCFAAGALDVCFIPLVMKKSRPGTRLSLLTRRANLNALRDCVFTHSTTIGLREAEVMRRSLVRTQEGAVKTAFMAGKKTRSKIEYEARADLARARNISLFEADEILKRETLKKDSEKEGGV